jgi:hypothetical protein
MRITASAKAIRLPQGQLHTKGQSKRSWLVRVEVTFFVPPLYLEFVKSARLAGLDKK